MSKAPSIKEALERLIADIEDYERVNNLAPSPGKKDCWQSVTNAKAALATFQPDGERREAIAFKIYSHSNNPKLWDYPNSVLARDNAYSIADLLLASGLVQNEAAIRADEREKCAKIADREAEFWQDAGSSSSRIVAANIRSARNGGAET